MGGAFGCALFLRYSHRERDWHMWLESRRRGAFWRLQIEPISLLIWYYYLWFPPKILKNTCHSLLPCLNIPKVWTGRFCGPCWTDDYENIFAKILFLSLYLGATINLISTNLTCNQVNLYHYFTNKKILTWLIDGTVCTFKV